AVAICTPQCSTSRCTGNVRMASSSSSETSKPKWCFNSMLLELLQRLLELVARHPRAGANLDVGIAEACRQGGRTWDWSHDQAFRFNLRLGTNDGPAARSETGQDLAFGQRWIGRVGVEDGQTFFSFTEL